MHLPSAALVLATALSGVAAHPSMAHRHAHLHRAVEARSNKFVKFDPPAESTPTPTPSPTPSATPTPSSSPSDDKDDDDSYEEEEKDKPSGEKKAFCSGKKKRATTYDIAYQGNLGAADDWGCNIMEVDCDTLDLYDYTAVFAGAGDDTYSCSAFNKIGPTGGIDGFWHSALDFQVKKGGKVCLAFDENSQGGVACGEGSDGPPKTGMGQLAGAWAEFDFGSGKNKGQSGADVSTIVADTQGGKDGIIAMSIEAPGKGTCSKLSLENPDESFEVYRGGMEDEDGVGCKGYSKGGITVTLGE